MTKQKTTAVKLVNMPSVGVRRVKFAKTLQGDYQVAVCGNAAPAGFLIHQVQDRSPIRLGAHPCNRAIVRPPIGHWLASLNALSPNDRGGVFHIGYVAVAATAFEAYQQAASQFW